MGVDKAYVSKLEAMFSYTDKDHDITKKRVIQHIKAMMNYDNFELESFTTKDHAFKYADFQFMLRYFEQDNLEQEINNLKDDELIKKINDAIAKYSASDKFDVSMIPALRSIITIAGINYTVGVMIKDEVFITGMQPDVLYKNMKIKWHDKKYRLLYWEHYPKTGTKLYVEEIK